MRQLQGVTVLSLLLTACGTPGGPQGADLQDRVEPGLSAQAVPTFPTATGTTSVTASIRIAAGQSFDAKNRRYVGTSGSQAENQAPLFILENGARISNVILGNPAGDGVHCLGTCTLTNVWWEDVGEDAATFKGTSASQTMTVTGGGARYASDKVFQHNGPGTMIIRDFYAQNYGTLYRSCGNCKTQHARKVVIENVTARDGSAKFVGVNQNYGDRAQLRAITIIGKRVPLCVRYNGNNTGAEPTTISGSGGPYSPVCSFATSDVTYR